jgi:hypothetical protein
MAKKTGKKSTRPAYPSSEFAQFLVRVDPSVREWLSETAAHNGLSRDAFVRLIFNTAKASWDDRDDDAQRRMFETVTQSLEEVVQRAVRDAVNNAPEAVVSRKIRGPGGTR